MNSNLTDIDKLRSGFENYYQNHLKSYFEKIEKERKKYLLFFIIGILIMFVILPLICIGLFWLFLLQNNQNFHYGDE